MIGIIGAMAEEVAAIKEYITVNDTYEYMGFTFYQGKIENKEVVIVQGDIGKVNTAICTTLLLEKYNVKYLINIGSAGGLQTTQSVGDVVVSSGVIHHDVDVTAFNYELGQVPQLPLVFEANKKLIEETTNILKENNINSQIGLIVSGDQFISREEQSLTIKNNFKDALCSEMEAATVGHVAYCYKVPFIIIRSLSDVYGQEDQSVQFDKYIAKAAKNSAILCKELVLRDFEL